jgi:hypothetical protein
MKLNLKQINYWWIVLAFAIILFMSINHTPSMQSVADIEGTACNSDDDCLCWGSVDGTDVYGIGTGRCISGACDMTFCIDIQPVGDFFVNYPFRWFKENIVLALGLIILGTLGAVYLPKV